MNTTSKDTFFTIIIPTRERSDTLMHTIETVLSQDYDNFRILISDNASVDQTKEKVEALDDPRIQYINTGRRISMSENWEFAIDHVSGGWVTVIGDDDGLMPGALKIVDQFVKNTGMKAVRCSGTKYLWPGVNGTRYGSMLMSCRRGYEIRSSGKFLQKALNGNAIYNDLPMLYNGSFVSFDLIKAAKKISGKLFQSMNPDIYSAIVFSHLTESYLYCYEPWAISGLSAHSTGTATFSKTKTNATSGPLESFYKEPNIPWHEDVRIPESVALVRSIQLLVYESYLQASSFHHLKLISVSRRRQVGIILSSIAPDPHEILEWARRFCVKHDIKLPSRALVKYLSLLNFLKRVPHFRSRLAWVQLNGSMLMPLQNVQEAAQAAAFVREMPPSLFQRIGSRTKWKRTK